MSEKELGLVLTNLSVTVEGETTRIPVEGIAFLMEELAREQVEDAIRFAERIDALHADIEVWHDGAVIDTLSFDREDFDADDFWGVFYTALREAYSGRAESDT